MKIKYILSAMLLSAVVSGVNAQETYSLSDCERMAIENNRKLQNAKLSVEAARQTRKEVFTSYFPEISATGAWFNANHGLARTAIRRRRRI